MATIETEIDIKALKSSGLRGGKLLDYAFNVLGYDGEKTGACGYSRWYPTR